MVFSSTVFLFLFLPVLCLVYFSPLCRKLQTKNVVLLLGSLIFYAWGEPVFVFLMMLSIVVTYLIGLGIEPGRKHRRLLLMVGVSYHVALLFIMKYLTFLAAQIGLLIDRDTSGLTLSLPIGISFFTFQMMSYLFDIYGERAQAQKNPLYVGLYVAMFPQLIAGPIVRYEQIAEELTSREVTFGGFAAGMKRFVYGLAKKVLIANYIAQIADNIFDYMDERAVLMAWLGALAYTLQIYFDFSGYSDMAIGLGRMFGFTFPENFRYPYISRNVTEFWRRWHISLSSWFRDYIYIPMGGNRVSCGRWIWNLFVVWALTGIWHGANWTFLCWGLFYFVLLVMEKLTGLAQKKTIWSWLYTFVAVNVAWVMFRAPNLIEGCRFIGSMFGIGADGFLSPTLTAYVEGTWVVLVLALLGATPLFAKCIRWLKERRVGWIEDLWIVLIFGVSLLCVISDTYNPFIYFNF